jgi:heavy metal sensor kinase
MRSIRFSLLVYFLGLLGVALGIISVLVYGTTQATLADKKHATTKLIERQYEDLCIQEKKRLDEALLSDARNLVNHSHIQVDTELAPPIPDGARGQRRHHATAVAAAVGLLAAGQVPNGHVTGSPWTLQAVNTLSGLPRWPAADLRLDETEPPDPGRSVVDYVQILCPFPFGVAYRSRSLERVSLAPPAEPGPPREYLGPEYRDVDLEPGVTVRRVMFRARVHFDHAGNTGTVWPPPGPGDNRPARSGGDKPPRGQFQVGGVVYAAYGPGRYAAAIAPFQAQRDDELARLEQETSDELANLRNHLLLVTLASFAAIVVGVYFLVRMGLMPLHRLGDAVSRVSEKDFRLRFSEERIPIELNPIVDRLKQTLDQLRLAFEREKQAAADISHELRTPVAALLTTIEVALKKPRKPDEYRETLVECRESGQQISQLVERLLTLARIDAGVDRLRVEKVDVAALAEQCTALVRPLAEARGLTLRLHGDGEALLQADPGKLREVLTNLLHNAIEYNRPAGSIDLTVARHNGTLCVEVRDTGVGIAPEARAHIFERFYRADPSRQAEGLHAGLGLAIVKGYVDLMGGSIDVESDVGRGSTFRVELPAA